MITSQGQSKLLRNEVWKGRKSVDQPAFESCLPISPAVWPQAVFNPAGCRCLSNEQGYSGFEGHKNKSP